MGGRPSATIQTFVGRGIEPFLPFEPALDHLI